MQWTLLALALLGVSALAKELPVCEVSEFTQWEACPKHPKCRQDKSSLRTMSYGMEPEVHDTGRVHMNLLKMEKARQWSEKQACKADGSCPQYDNIQPRSGAAFDCVNGAADIFPCRNVGLLSFVDFAGLGYGVPHASDNAVQGNDVWGWLDPETGDEYAIMCLSGATSFVRVTDPVNPVTVALMFTETTATSWRDAKVIGNYAYIISEAPGHGLQIFDMTTLRGKNDFSIVEATHTYFRFGNAHNIVANEETGFIYVVGATQGPGDICAGGLHVIDVRDPSNPQFVGCFGGDGYVHDAECVIYRGPDVEFFGSEICFCYNENSFTIVDVSDKNNMNVIGKSGYPNVRYSHQGWLTEDQTIVLLDDELDELLAFGVSNTQTYVWDVTSLRAPTLKNVYESTERSIDHNQYILGDLTFQANYEAGLRILHINQETYDLNEVAYFDVLPGSTSRSFNGAWSNYPYFPSGNVLIGSIDFGLFVVRPNYDAMRDEINTNTAVTEQRRFRQVVGVQEGAVCPPLFETRQCQPIEC